MRAIVCAFIFCFLFQNCSTVKIKDIPFMPAGSVKGEKLALNIFAPKDSKDKNLPVLIFIHGGNWNTGNKNTYGFYGRNFAKKDVIVVVPDYTLSPDANVDEMASQVAQAIFWTKNNIAAYGGNPEKLFLTGHSAGAQLAALAVLNPKYQVPKNMVSGMIINDGAGMDLEVFLQNSPPTDSHDYLATFSNDADKWKQASPATFLSKDTPPVLLYIGQKTYPVLKLSSEVFMEQLQKFQPEAKAIYVNRSHIPMLLQYINGKNPHIDETVNFIRSNQKVSKKK